MIFSKELAWKNATVPLMFCIALIALCCVPAVVEQILILDYLGFNQLNPLVANSPVFDRLIRLFAVEDRRLQFIIPVLIGLVIYLYRANDQLDRYRRFAFILFMVVVLAIAMVIEKQVDLIVNRQSPAFTVKSFENLRKIYGWTDFTPKERHTFPSDEAWFMLVWGFTLIFMKARKWGVAAVVLGFAASLARCIAGTTWLSDIYLGAVPGAWLLAVVATRTPFAELLPWLENLVVVGIDRGRVLRRKAEPLVQLRSWPLDLNQALHLEIAVKRYVRRNIPVELGHNPQDESLKVAIEMPLYGMRSLVRKVTVNDKSVILRVYPAHRHFEAHRYNAAAGMLSSHNIRVPKVLSLKKNGRTGALFMLEEFVEGKFVRGGSMTERELEAVTDEMARMHSVHNNKWGPADMIRLEDHYATIVRRAKRQLARVAQISKLEGVKNVSEGQKQVNDWLLGWKDTFAALRHYTLVHNNLHRENGLFMADGRYCLLDNSTVEWGVPARDISLVHDTMCEGNPEIIARFNNSYYRKLPDTDRGTLRKLSPFYDVLLKLNYLARSVRRLNIKIDNESAGDRQAERWESILAIVDSSDVRLLS